MLSRIAGYCLGVILGAAALCAAPADAAEVSFGASAATDYVWRGVSQSDENPAIFVTGQVSHKGFYAGAGAENVDFLGIDTEYDLWAGWAGEVAGVSVDVGVVRYGYVDAPAGTDLDTVDFKLGVSDTLGPATLGAVAMYTPDYFATENPSIYGEVNLAFAVAEKWTLSGAVGRQEIDPDSASYTHWRLGAAYAVNDNVTLTLNYHDTDAHAAGKVFDSRVVVGFRVKL
ncbi:MAG: TonB-dependent receptor [Hyphomonadaceae bacterium]|nr:TonB-dependent receptor [Hyphomonadaceae bacterium]